MDPWRTSTGLAVALAALGRPEDDTTVRRVAEAFGVATVATRERLVGQPARRSRRLVFASGGEIVVHDDAVVAVILRLAAASGAPGGVDLSAWIPGIDHDATLRDLVAATGAQRSFAGLATPYLRLDGGYARLDFADRGWNDPGNLLGITVTATQPGLACRPEDDDCPTCRDLLVRPTGRADGVDVAGTTAALAAALASGLLTEDLHWVRLADLRPLHASRLMERVETQLTCTTCRRIICFTLHRDASPTFGYHVLNDASRRPLDAIPPVEAWGDADRIAEDRDAMHHVDHEPGAWFLVEQRGVLFLDARYSEGAAVDGSALIRLDDAECEAYRDGGRRHLSELARSIHDSAPHRDGSRYRPRDLYQGPDGPAWRAAVTGAIVNHTWIARQRRTTPPDGSTAEA